MNDKSENILVLPKISQNYLTNTPKYTLNSKFPKRSVYECYKPTSLDDVKEYIYFVTSYRSIICHEMISDKLENEQIPDINFDTPPIGLSLKLTNYLRGISKIRKDPKNKSILWFDSNFECGNLERAIIKDNNEYELYINSDTNAVGMYQWFYFLVENTKENQTINFKIMNQTKFSKFYAEDGMCPVVFSETDYKENILWTHDNINNCYLSKQHDYVHLVKGRSIPIKGKNESYIMEENYQYYCLSFAYTFKHSNDKVYFAFCHPYPFMRLYRVLSKIETQLFQESVNAACQNVNSLANIQIETNEVFYKRNQLCKTTGGLPIECITITEPKKQNPHQYIVITARVHAAEIPASYSVEQIMNFLVSSDKVAAALRKQYTFIIVPMLNPDGVVMGNTRYSIEGEDLNRRWDNPSTSFHPAVYYLKEHLRILVSDRSEIKVYCDLHGHSKRYNSFIYACHHVLSATHDSWNSTRLLTRIMAKKCNMFDYHQCSFEIRADKLNTARVIIWKEFRVIHSFTLQTSVYAYTLDNQIVQFKEKDYLYIGKALMLSLYEYGVILGKLNEPTGGLKIHKTIEDDTKKKKETPSNQIPNKAESHINKMQKFRPKSNISKTDVTRNSSSLQRKNKVKQIDNTGNILINEPFVETELDEIIDSIGLTTEDNGKEDLITETGNHSHKVNIKNVDTDNTKVAIRIKTIKDNKNSRNLLNKSNILSTLNKKIAIELKGPKPYTKFDNIKSMVNDSLKAQHEKKFVDSERIEADKKEASAI